MKLEYMIASNGCWYHFATDAIQGFCVYKKRGARFYFAESLLKDAFCDFCVTSFGNDIHAVCQDKKGTIWHFHFDGAKWNRTPLLESRDKVAQFKNLTLISSTKAIHLFYVIDTKEGNLLVHQFLTSGSKDPTVIDYINGTEFSACSHENGDCTVLYHTAENVLGTKRYRWSKKAFEAFTPLDCDCALSGIDLLADPEENLYIAGYATFDKFTNILFLKKDALSQETTLSAVHLVSGISEGISFLDNGDGLQIFWCENGLVMSSKCNKELHWSTPQKYIRGTTTENVLYKIENGLEHITSYGCMQDGKIILYASSILPEHPQKSSPVARGKTTAPKMPAPNTPKPVEFVKRSVYLTDMAALRKLLAGQNDVIVEMMKKIAALEHNTQKNTSLSAEELAEDSSAIDRLAAENL